jgi:Chalcone isomerase-like
MVMYRDGLLAAILLGLGMPTDAAEPGVTLGRTRYPATITSHSGGEPVKMVLTGAAMRTRWGFSVYSVGSYVREGVAVRGAADLVGAAVPKQLLLCFERDVDGATLAQSFRDAIALNHPAPAFAAEVAALSRFLEASPVKEGDRLWLSSIPGVGLRCQRVGGPEVTIGGVAFAHAVWEIYLGRKNLGAAIQSGLTSRL